MLGPAHNSIARLPRWSIGCIFAELLRGDPLCPAQTELELVQRLFKLLGPPTPEVSRCRLQFSRPPLSVLCSRAGVARSGGAVAGVREGHRGAHRRYCGGGVAVQHCERCDGVQPCRCSSALVLLKALFSKITVIVISAAENGRGDVVVAKTCHHHVLHTCPVGVLGWRHKNVYPYSVG